MRAFLAYTIAVIAITISIGFMLREIASHLPHRLTPDQLYGCSVEQEAPNGECE